MSQKLIGRSDDLKKLRDEGFEVEVNGAHLLVHNIPYLNNERQVVRASMVCDLTLAGDRTTIPGTHVMYFTGEYPCTKDGKPITQLRHGSSEEDKGGVRVKHSFSNKPPEGYKDYYHKVVTYYEIISAHARSIDPTATAKTFRAIASVDDETVLRYVDTNSSRAGIDGVSAKLANQKVGIIGLGGTGSYVLDLVAKTHVKEIRLFDGDDFLQHNAFRSPGAPSFEELEAIPTIKKVTRLYGIYSRIHGAITAHEVYITSENFDKLEGLDFIFICIDSGEARKAIMAELLERGVPFVDTGIGVHLIDGALHGSMRVTAADETKNDHLDRRVPFGDGEDDYRQNIQIAELNALNAALAVIKWKKMYGFYHDLEEEYNVTYSIYGSNITLDEIRT